MESGDIQSIEKNIDALEKEIKKLEEAYEDGDSDEFNDSKERMLDAQSKVKKELE